MTRLYKLEIGDIFSVNDNISIPNNLNVKPIERFIAGKNGKKYKFRFYHFFWPKKYKFTTYIYLGDK